MGSAEASHWSAAARTMPTTPGAPDGGGVAAAPADSSAWPMTAEIWSAMWWVTMPAGSPPDGRSSSGALTMKR